MDRRRLLIGGGAALAGAALSACVPTRALRDPRASDLSYDDACDLPPVHVSPEREIRTVVGLRPFRRSGFRVEAERIGDTLVVHNYGHGGSGITLSWGTSKLALDLGLPGHRGAVAVLGCGAVGLSNAILLQEAGFEVTIRAKSLPPETTSNIAGGQWFPAFLADRAQRTPAFDTQLLAAARYAWRRYQTMMGPRWGVRWMRNYYLSDEPFRESGDIGIDSPLRSMMPEFRDLGSHEHPFAGRAHVRRFDTPIIEPPVYLAAMLDEFRVAGGRVVVGEIADRAALHALPEKLVFNCTGLGAKALFGDDALTPVKGQLTVLLPQPEVQYSVISGDCYMFSRSDGVLLGGTHVEGDGSLEPDLAAKARILAGHRAIFDGFRACAKHA